MEYSLCIKLKNSGRPFFGPGPMRLLTLVRDGDSLNQAASKMRMAYSKAWRILHEAETELGFPLLLSQRGGTGGGGSALTDDALALLEKYDRFQQDMYQAGNQLFAEYFGERS